MATSKSGLLDAMVGARI